MKKTGTFLLTAVLLFSVTACNEQDLNEQTKTEAINLAVQPEVYSIIEEDIIIGEGSEWELSGKLTLPEDYDSDKKLPAVVLVHGSGGSDMDETAYAYKPFKDIAEYLTSKGIAVLRYDKRTFVHGSKIITNIKDFTIKEETIDDAILAAELLKNDSRIDSEKVFVAGHSLGGMIAPRIDAEGGDFAGLIILAGSPRLFSEIWYDQAVNEVEALPDDQKLLGNEQINAIMTIFNSFKSLSDEECKEYSFMGATGYYYKDFDAYPATDYLDVITKPVLIMQGGKDFQVFEDKDFSQYKDLYQSKSNFTFKLYPELNHCFIKSTTGTIDEYAIRDTVNEDVLKDIADWIIQN